LPLLEGVSAGAEGGTGSASATVGAGASSFAGSSLGFSSGSDWAPNSRAHKLPPFDCFDSLMVGSEII
jgi:hypothetical protein